MTKRDPKIEPLCGDQLRKGKRLRIVDWNGRCNPSIVSYRTGTSEILRQCWITAWQDWARDADVLERAEDIRDVKA